MLIHQGLKSPLASGYLTHNFCSWRKGKLLSQLQIDRQPDGLRSWQVLIFSQKERTVSTQEAIISIQEISFFTPQSIYFFTAVSLPMAAAHILPCEDQGSSAQAPDGIRQLGVGGRGGLWLTKVTPKCYPSAEQVSVCGTWHPELTLPGGGGHGHPSGATHRAEA